MHCSVFRSNRKAFTYLYLRAGTAFEDLPTRLQAAFGPPEFVMNLELSPGRALATEDAEAVMRNLRNNGFHLQLPPGDQNGDPI
jgi:uncharacterized protein YcgL (UPF0745 family)